MIVDNLKEMILQRKEWGKIGIIFKAGKRSFRMGAAGNEFIGHKNVLWNFRTWDSGKFIPLHIINRKLINIVIKRISEEKIDNNFVDTM